VSHTKKIHIEIHVGRIKRSGSGGVLNLFPATIAGSASLEPAYELSLMERGLKTTPKPSTIIPQQNPFSLREKVAEGRMRGKI
jgi:hypothetical protein